MSAPPDEIREADAEAARRARIERWIAARAAMAPTNQRIGPAPRRVSLGQRGLLFQAALKGAQNAGSAFCYRLSGPLDASTLARAFDIVVERHEPLPHAVCRHCGWSRGGSSTSRGDVASAKEPSMPSVPEPVQVDPLKPCVRHLHVRLDRQAKGRRDHARFARHRPRYHRRLSSGGVARATIAVELDDPARLDPGLERYADGLQDLLLDGYQAPSSWQRSR